ncbi:amino acid permease [Dictyocaulus viviparus]|uniref:Amino acid permease n=1 Tax=Dictyocaulus viviparus TaxID=29172 RepID=A0A0D8Y472_DICVI|nr:amino acid permease [Dictyocaulus viviparus]
MAKKEANRLGVLGATSYIVGSVIGSGIFVSPKGILIYTGSVGLSLIVWVLSASLASLTAINYIELGTSIPESGAEFAYLNFVGWKSIAFSYLWLASIIQGSCGGATLALTFGEYIIEAIIPITCLSPSSRKISVILLAYGILLATSLLNMFSLSRFAGRIQVVSMITKLTALAIIIGIGLFYIFFRGETQHFSRDFFFKGSEWSASHIVLALYQGTWAYEGYTILNYGMEDIQIKDFKRTVPIAVLSGLFVSAFVYVMANVAYFTVLTPQQILDSSAVATTFAQKTVGSFSYAMPALIGLLMVGSINGEMFAWSREATNRSADFLRFMLAGSRRGMMPTAWSLIHPENDSPRIAVLTHVLLSMIFCLIGDVYVLINYLALTSLTAIMFSVGALAIIKWKSIPVSANAVKFHIFWPILNFLINASLLLIPIVVEPVQSAVSIGLFTLGIGCYFLFMRTSKKPQFLLKIDAFVTYVCQQISWTVIDTTPTYKVEGVQEKTTTIENKS